MRFPLLSHPLALAAVLCVSASCFAQEHGDEPPQGTPTAAAKDAAKDAKDKPSFPPLPPDAHVEQSITVDGKPLKYTVTVGTLPVRNADGKVAGQVVFTSYTVPGADRPVTFALNGGPGAASVYLNFGAIGPKRVPFGEDNSSPSDTPTLVDNPGTWLDFTDLVFIDPIGTGFSRSEVSEAESKKLFYAPTADVNYLSRIIYDWLLKNGRMMSRKYLIGESYGGFRGPRITRYLQTQLGVGLNGVVLVSPYLNPSITDNGDLSPLPWIVTMPSMAAANLERQGKLTSASMKDVIDYAEGEYATDLIRGSSDPGTKDRMVAKVTQLTGLDPDFVRAEGGRIEPDVFLREVHRKEGKLGSVYDSNVTALDPFPYNRDQKTGDPILDTIIAPLTQSMVNFVTQTVGWKVDARYNALSYEVGRMWDRSGRDERSGSGTQLRQAVAADPKLHVLIAHGWNDLSCPFMGSIVTVNQIPQATAQRILIHEYPGGHMFYTRSGSQKSLKQDARELFTTH
ncbi:S10 family peptidase [Terriglobus sp. ADX1]|uniref:S10 family peptidase n=1 Tax=Terriglobus sp. ADX1 TaxID=2794063 RepID=UPI002FE6886E